MARLPRPPRRLARLGLNLSLAVAAAGFVALGVGPHLLPYRTVTMLTGSMTPAIRPGSVAVVVPEPPSAVRAGQMITFQAPVPGAPTVTHRVVSVTRRGGDTLVRTKGDANPAADPWLAKVEGERVWRVRAVVPAVGHAITGLRTPTASLLLTRLAPAALLCWLLAGIWRPKPGPQ